MFKKEYEQIMPLTILFPARGSLVAEAIIYYKNNTFLYNMLHVSTPKIHHQA
jgi:hypothetical protein